MSGDGLLSLRDKTEGKTKADIKMPAEEAGERIRKLLKAEKKVLVIVFDTMGDELVVDVKSCKE